MNDQLTETLRLALRVKRKRQGLTQQQLGARLGWRQSKIAKIERRNTMLPIGEVFAMVEALKQPATLEELEGKTQNAALDVGRRSA